MENGLRSTELSEVLTELSQGLTGAWVQKVHVPVPGLCYLELRLSRSSVLLCLCARGNGQRVSVASKRPPNPQNPPAQQFVFRRSLLGAQLVKLDQSGPLHVVFHFKKKDFLPRLVVGLDPSGHAGKIFLNQDGEQSDAFLGPRTSHSNLPSRLIPKRDSTFPLAEAAEDFFSSMGEQRHSEEHGRLRTKLINAQLKKLDRTLEKVRAESSREVAASEHRRLGALISQNAGKIARGQVRMWVNEYSADGASEVEIPLDPKRSPKDLAAWHFHQYQRMTRGMIQARSRLSELTLQRELIEAQLRSEDLSQLAAIPETLAGTQESERRAKPYKIFRTASGKIIWVGKNAKGNETLTFKVAQPHHLWLHASGTAGAHVVIPLGRSEVAESDTLIDAAHLALHYSSLKDEPQAEVTQTRVKYVRKVKGGTSGQVTYSREKNLWIRKERERLQRLLNDQLHSAIVSATGLVNVG